MVEIPLRSVFRESNISKTAVATFDATSHYVAGLIRDTLLVHEHCRIVVSGGRSIQLTLERLSLLSVPWSNVIVFVADERCVQLDSNLRNDRLIRDSLIDRVGIQTENFINIRTENGGREAVLDYRQVLANISNFDIALLGVGPDGHIGSLFPDHHSIASAELALLVTDSPKEPSDRVSVGIGMLQRATHRIVVVVGEDKSALIALVNDGAKLPVTLFDPTMWFLDAAAARTALTQGFAETKEGSN